MERIAVAVVGVEAKDLTVLKSLLNLMTGSLGASWQQVEDPWEADLAFLGQAMAKEEMQRLAQDLAGQVMLVSCCPPGEAAPEGIVAAHCPPRSAEMARIFSEVIRRNREKASPAANQATSMIATVENFDGAHCLVGAIQGMLPRLLIDQPLLVTATDAPPLLVDVHVGFRTVHADPVWFSDPQLWRMEAGNWSLSTAPDAARYAECRRHHARPYPALHFWGVLCASRGRLLKELAQMAEIGLRKLPDFKLLPHVEWQRLLAGAMVEKRASMNHWVTVAGRPREDVADFLNACSVLGLVKQ